MCIVDIWYHKVFIFSISGVVELINKTDGQSFTKNDQELFSQYIEHCSKIYDTAKVS